MSEVIRHYLPATYNGRCSDGVDGVDFHTSWLSHPKDSKHKFEARIPIPEVECNCSDLWGADFDNAEAARRIALSVSTGVDEQFKRACFGAEAEYDSDGKKTGERYPLRSAEEVTDQDHLDAQKVYDEWTFEKRVPKEKTSTPVASITARFVQTGKMSPEEAAQIKTTAQLDKWLSENL